MESDLLFDNKMSIKNILIIIAGILLLIISVFFIIDKIKNSFIYFNAKVSEHQKPDLEYHETKLSAIFNAEIKIKDIMIKTDDGESINAFYMINPTTDNVILHCHGNAGLIYNMLPLLSVYGKNASVIMFDYRGYGRSTGTPYERGLYNDVYSVWNYLITTEKVNPNKITIFGHSLGAGVASWLGKTLADNAKVRPKGLILQAGFSCLKNIGNKFFPKGMLTFIQNEYQNDKNVETIGDKIPILLLHSKKDEVIPVDHADTIYNANDNIIKVLFDDGDHNIVTYDQKNYLKILEGFIA